MLRRLVAIILLSIAFASAASAADEKKPHRLAIHVDQNDALCGWGHGVCSVLFVIARSEATKQSSFLSVTTMDCFAALAMTAGVNLSRDLRQRRVECRCRARQILER